ncbi:hypothetical protein CS546_06810 [Porphyromonas gingivalis]|nr:hypothetical protein CS546_06810 [Porphyromonas gingivalis]ATR95945.1 hypothetical protein CS548_01925 [Porphyromonas gingivalis]
MQQTEKPEKRHNLPLTCIGLLLFPSDSDLFSFDPPSPSSSFYVPKNCFERNEKTWRENFLLPAPEEKSSQTKTKNLWFHFSGKHERQFVRFTLEKIICSFSANKL